MIFGNKKTNADCRLNSLKISENEKITANLQILPVTIEARTMEVTVIFKITNH